MSLLYDWSVFSKTFNIGGFTGNVGTAFIFFNFVFLEDLFELEHLGYHVISIAPGIELIGVFRSVLSVSLVSTIVVIKSVSVVVSVGTASRATAESTQKRWTEGIKGAPTAPDSSPS